MKMSIRTRLGLLISLVTAGADACRRPELPRKTQPRRPPRTPQPKPPPPRRHPPLVARGDTVFHGPGNCYACHGTDAKGLVGPNLTDAEWIHSKGTYDEIVAQIKHGVPKAESKSGIEMPPRGGGSISDDDVKAVAAYVLSLGQKSGS